MKVKTQQIFFFKLVKQLKLDLFVEKKGPKTDKIRRNMICL